MLPEGEKVDFNPDSVLQFPVGTVLIKTFYYPIDERNLALGNRMIETRLLIHDKNKGWDALTYIWNEDQSDAILEIAGDTKPYLGRIFLAKKIPSIMLYPIGTNAKDAIINIKNGAHRSLGSTTQQNRFVRKK